MDHYFTMMVLTNFVIFNEKIFVNGIKCLYDSKSFMTKDGMMTCEANCLCPALHLSTPDFLSRIGCERCCCQSNNQTPIKVENGKAEDFKSTPTFSTSSSNLTPIQVVNGKAEDFKSSPAFSSSSSKKKAIKVEKKIPLWIVAVILIVLVLVVLLIYYYPEMKTKIWNTLKPSQTPYIDTDKDGRKQLSQTKEEV